MLKLHIPLDVAKFLGELQAKQFRQVVTKVLDLLHNPRPQDHKQLSGYPYLRTDSGEYRIIYLVDGDSLRIILIGKRNDDEVYKILKRKN